MATDQEHDTLFTSMSWKPALRFPSSSSSSDGLSLHSSPFQAISVRVEIFKICFVFSYDCLMIFYKTISHASCVKRCNHTWIHLMSAYFVASASSVWPRGPECSRSSCIFVTSTETAVGKRSEQKSCARLQELHVFFQLRWDRKVIRWLSAGVKKHGEGLRKKQRGFVR